METPLAVDLEWEDLAPEEAALVVDVLGGRQPADLMRELVGARR